MDKAQIIIFVPGEEEFEAVKELDGTDFQNFRVRRILTGPGQINTAAAVAFEAASFGPPPALLIGAGLCGSLQLGLKAGETVVSDSVAIGDWIMENDHGRTYGVYGGSSYTSLTGGNEALVIKGQSRLVEELLVNLSFKGFRKGRLLSTDTHVSGPSGKLERGRLWGCLACDHESGALARVAMDRAPEVPWLNIRVVADTIGEQMGAEGRAVDLLEILVLKLLVLLSNFDVNFPKCGCENCGGLCCPGLMPGKIR